MVKAKAKAERAAARQAHAATISNLAAAGLLILDQPSPANAGPSEDSPAPEASGAEGTNDSEETPAAAASKEPTADRTELLRSKPEVVNRFMHLMVPILVDVYAASVITPVRIKTLTGLLKAVSFLDGDELKRVFTVCTSCLCPYDTSNFDSHSLFLWRALRRQSYHLRTIPL